MRTRSTLFGALALTAILAACGGGGSTPLAAGAESTTASATSSPAGSTSSTTTDQRAQRQAYSQCLQDHGVPAGALGAGPRQATTTDPTATTVDPNVMAQARQACANLRPAGGFGAGPSGQGNPAMQAYFDCLAQHGVTVPTTVPGASTTGPPPTFNRNDPTFKAAQQACASLRPQRGNGTTTTTTG